MKSTTKRRLETLFLDRILHNDTPTSPLVTRLRKEFNPEELRQIVELTAEAIDLDERLTLVLSKSKSAVNA